MNLLTYQTPQRGNDGNYKKCRGGLCNYVILKDVILINYLPNWNAIWGPAVQYMSLWLCVNDCPFYRVSHSHAIPHSITFLTPSLLRRLTAVRSPAIGYFCSHFHSHSFALAHLLFWWRLSIDYFIWFFIFIFFCKVGLECEYLCVFALHSIYENLMWNRNWILFFILTFTKSLLVHFLCCVFFLRNLGCACITCTVMLINVAKDCLPFLPFSFSVCVFVHL